MKDFHLHLISDSTGETVSLVARACLAQFDGVQAHEHMWSMVRSPEQIDQILDVIHDQPGMVLYTLVHDDLRKRLEDGCRRLMVPHIPVLDPVLGSMGVYFNAKVRARPGRQHVMDAEYFDRIEAMHFALSHDDGQSTWDLDEADVVLVGVSRTSKTPTSVYLANRGLKTANVPFVPGVPLPDDLFRLNHPLVVGLTKDPRRLVEIRRQRLRLLDQDENTDYVDLDMVSKEITEARRVFAKYDWPVINVTRKSIEETAANVIQLLSRRRGETPGPLT
ncbi:MAG: phosphoenolpyruvate synthase regulatory protein [Rhodospirillales bacterium CG15_BIG_FIL_POST_REV_8_21_14_020_66_15]|nr:MAG: phosphoenolpyruvate synthase regulatory protein [Rhodospirillales bacterium CG15_BIG_FIL_POST_REV_8_21_14_020_66_15]